MKPRFKTNAGLCTPYALACGYGDVYREAYNYRCTHFQDANTYHVRLHGEYCNNVINGTEHNQGSTKFYWAVFETLAEARKAYNKAKREVDKFVPR